MRVLHLLYECRPSGAEVMLKLAAPYWRSWGCTLGILTIGPDEGEYTDVLREAGYEVCAEPFPRDGLKLIPWMNRFRNQLREFSPDIIVNHNETIQPLLALLCYGIGKGQCRIVHSFFRFPPLLRLRKAIERLLTRTLKIHQIAISPAVAEIEWTQYRNRTNILENWFDSDNFRPPSSREVFEAKASLSISRDSLVLVTIGNGADIKNYRVIIETLAQIPSSTNVIYLQVGREHPLAIDRSLANQLNQSARVRFCGPQNDIRRYLWASDIYLAPSLYEGFSISTAEAIAAGTPAILADIPGLQHFRKLGPRVLFCPTEPGEIIDKINQIISMAPTHDHSASAVVCRRYGLQEGALRYFKVWESLISRSDN